MEPYSDLELAHLARVGWEYACPLRLVATVLRLRQTIEQWPELKMQQELYYQIWPEDRERDGATYSLKGVR